MFFISRIREKAYPDPCNGLGFMFFMEIMGLFCFRPELSMSRMVYYFNGNSFSSSSEGMSLTEVLAARGDSLGEKDHLPFYLLSLRRRLVALPEDERSPACEIGNCQFRLWLSLAEGEHGRSEWRAYSESSLVSGVLFLILEPLNGRSLPELREIDWIRVEQRWPAGMLDTGRGGSLHTLFSHIRRMILGENS